jgi:Kef-type K+ transport system membrane component KefB
MILNPLTILTALAVVLIGSLVGGRIAARLHVPRVTGYLVIGLLAGPSFADLVGLPYAIPPQALAELQLLTDIALVLILVTIGGQFRTETLRRWHKRIIYFSVGDFGVTFLSVATTTLLCNLLILKFSVVGMSLWQTSLFFSIFLGIIAIATAPAATLMVVREYEAEGPATSAILTLVGLNNFVSIFLFAIAAHVLLQPEAGISQLLFNMFGPVLFGGLTGFILSVWAQRLELKSEYKILILGGVASCAAISHWLALDPLLTGLAMGVVLANSSPRWHLIRDTLREVDYPLYVAFFVVAGANLHIETLSHIGVLGVAYVVARTAGKIFGSIWGARLGQFDREKGYHVGISLLAQAGVAIGLASSLASAWPEGGKLLETVVLGSVIVFELIGPLAVRHGLVRAGEVPILSLLQKKAPIGAVEGLHNVVHHFRASLGMPEGHRLDDPGDILVKHIMRRNVETVMNDTQFNELLRLIAHSRYDRFPVIDEQNHFIGMIDYTEIRNLLFEPSLAQLVVASDLATPAHHAVAPEQTLREAMKILQLNRNISFFPVIDPEEPEHLLGILSQNDVLAAFRRKEID